MVAVMAVTLPIRGCGGQGCERDPRRVARSERRAAGLARRVVCGRRASAGRC